MSRCYILLILSLICLRQPARSQDFTPLGGEMTSFLMGPAAIQVYAPNVTSVEHRELQLSGFSPFHRFMNKEDGLGPRFVNSSCGGCHVENGRGRINFNHSPISGGGSLVVKVKYLRDSNGPIIGPVLQNHSVSERDFHNLRLRWKNIRGKYPDGSAYSLRQPILSFTLNGTSHRKFAYSLRMTPPIIGPGLIESIPESPIEALADITDLDGDGVSGKVNYVTNIRSGATEIGRFGFKAGQPTVEQQSAAALGNEMGLSNSLFPVAKNNLIEFSDDELNRVVIYQKLAGVPAARNQSNPEIALGKKLFFDIGCEDCHTSIFTTFNSDLPELSGQTIHPFSDFLLHDLGPGLADKLGESLARGSEWKTTPLWGLGFSQYLSRIRPNYLHDGRARTLEEAIIWHEGEAFDSRDQFMKLTKDGRLSLIAFLRSL